MSVPSQTVIVGYSGDGSSVTFSVPFVFEQQTDLLVTTYTAGIPSVKVYNVGYTVSGGDVGSGPANGSVTFGTAPASGTLVYIELSPPLQQQTTLIEGGALPAVTQTDVWDNLCLQIQTLKKQIGRCVQFPVDYIQQGFVPQIPEGQANGIAAGMTLIVNPSGNGFTWALPTTLAADVPDSVYMFSNNQIATAITGMSANGTQFRTVVYEYDIQRYDTLGSEYRATGKLKCQYKTIGGGWAFEDEFEGPTPTMEQTGVTFTIGNVGSVMQMYLASSNLAITGVHIGKLNFKTRTFNA